MRRLAVCVAVCLVVGCDGGAKRPEPAPPARMPAPTVPHGHLKLVLGTRAVDTVIVNADGSFALWTVASSRPDAAAPHPERFAVVDDARIMAGARELMSRRGDGTVDTWGLLDPVVIDEDGTLVADGTRQSYDAAGRLLGPDGAEIVSGATTAALRRRASLVLVFAALTQLTARSDGR